MPASYASTWRVSVVSPSELERQLRRNSENSVHSDFTAQVYYDIDFWEFLPHQNGGARMQPSQPREKEKNDGTQEHVEKGDQDRIPKVWPEEGFRA